MRFTSFKASALMAVVAMVGLSGPALAGGPVKSKVTIKAANNSKFKGKVTSAAADCVVGRKVQIYRDEGASNTKVAKTFASESGKYSVKIPMQAGNKLFAKVKTYESPLGTTCAKDKSKKVVG